MKRKLTRMDIAVQEKVQQYKDIDGVTYFFWKFLNNFAAHDMLKVLLKYGEILEVVIPPKRDKSGKRLGFICFM